MTTTTRVTLYASILAAFGIRLALPSVIITDDTILLPGIIITSDTIILPGFIINDVQGWQVLCGKSLKRFEIAFKIQGDTSGYQV